MENKNKNKNNSPSTTGQPGHERKPQPQPQPQPQQTPTPTPTHLAKKADHPTAAMDNLDLMLRDYKALCEILDRPTAEVRTYLGSLAPVFRDYGNKSAGLCPSGFDLDQVLAAFRFNICNLGPMLMDIHNTDSACWSWPAEPRCGDVSCADQDCSMVGVVRKYVDDWSSARSAAFFIMVAVAVDMLSTSPLLRHSGEADDAVMVGRAWCVFGFLERWGDEFDLL